MFDLGRSFLAATERRPLATAVSDGTVKKPTNSGSPISSALPTASSHSG